MTIAKSNSSDKSHTPQNPKDLLAELTNSHSKLISLVRTAVAEEKSFDEIERKTKQAVLEIGRQAMGLFVSLQGDGDLGSEVVSTNKKPLYRSEAKSLPRIRSIFGVHSF
ncbi:hypothetical protein SH449x_003244 [Pirellulaceae bacterium SH449]